MRASPSQIPLGFCERFNHLLALDQAKVELALVAVNLVNGDSHDVANFVLLAITSADEAFAVIVDVVDVISEA